MIINNWNFDWDSYWTLLYSYLDTLTLIEVIVLFHIVMMIAVLFLAFDICSILFSKEIIYYFKLEEKYPKLQIFFKYKQKFQKYNLGFNLLILFGVCIYTIGIDLILFGIAIF